jgi:hypothetical protein
MTKPFGADTGSGTLRTVAIGAAVTLSPIALALGLAVLAGSMGGEAPAGQTDSGCPAIASTAPVVSAVDDPPILPGATAPTGMGDPTNCPADEATTVGPGVTGPAMGGGAGG